VLGEFCDDLREVERGYSRVRQERSNLILTGFLVE